MIGGFMKYEIKNRFTGDGIHYCAITPLKQKP